MNEEYPRVLLLGNPLLKKVCKSVLDFGSKLLSAEAGSLHGVLLAFREAHGFGRGIAAPQIGILKRIVTINLDGRRTTMVNPEIIWSSSEEFVLWDDCMSFPDLLVKLKRKSSISVKFQDEAGQFNIWGNLEPSVSELLQHEIDHLDGILAIDRALDRNSISYRVNVPAATAPAPTERNQ
jgi:peptide deformylase